MAEPKDVTLKKAWLVTWVSAGTGQKGKIVSILNCKRSERSVMRFLEQVYADSQYTLRQRVLHARGESKNLAVPAEPERIHCVPMNDQITCGNKPALYARIVRNLRVTLDSNGAESLRWEEIKAEDKLPVGQKEISPPSPQGISSEAGDKGPL